MQPLPEAPMLRDSSAPTRPPLRGLYGCRQSVPRRLTAWSVTLLAPIPSQCEASSDGAANEAGGADTKDYLTFDPEQCSRPMKLIQFLYIEKVPERVRPARFVCRSER